MSLAFHTLRWLPVLCNTEERAQKLHKRIKEKVVEVMVAMTEGAGATPVEGSPENGGGGRRQHARRSDRQAEGRTVLKRHTVEAQRYGEEQAAAR